MADQSVWNKLLAGMSENPNSWGAGLGMAAQAVNPTGISGQIGGVSALMHQGAIMQKRQQEVESKRGALLSALMGMPVGGAVGGVGGNGGSSTGTGMNAAHGASQAATNGIPSITMPAQTIPPNMTAPGGAAPTAPFVQGSTDPLRAVLLASLLGGAGEGGTSLVGLSPEQIAAIGREERGTLGETLSIASLLGQSDRQARADVAQAEMAPLERRRMEAQTTVAEEQAAGMKAERAYKESPEYKALQAREQSIKEERLHLKGQENQLKAQGNMLEAAAIHGRAAKLEHEERILKRRDSLMAKADEGGLTVKIAGGQTIPLSMAMMDPEIARLVDKPSDKQSQIEAIARVEGISEDEAWARHGSLDDEEITLRLVSAMVQSPLAPEVGVITERAQALTKSITEPRKQREQAREDKRVTKEFLDSLLRGNN